MDELVNKAISGPDIHIVNRDTRANAHHVVALAKFSTETKTYQEVKEHLKNSLIEAQSLEVKS